MQVEHSFNGLPDFWKGDGNRWEPGRGCLFASYGGKTTLRDCVEQWVDDFEHGGDFFDYDGDVTGNDVREAIVDSFTATGLKDYEDNALCEFAKDCDGDKAYCVWIVFLDLEV